jgi:hypothetical protein
VEEEAGAARAGRCANHPALAEVGRCSICGRALCLTCATPVRGAVIGPECLSAVLDEMPPPTPLAIRIPPIADYLLVLGFGLVVALSLFPWSRFGDSSGFLEAWTIHWSLVACLGGVGGLAAAIWFSRRSADPRLETAVFSGLAIVVAVAAWLHFVRPPPLSDSAVAPLLAIVAALIALTGAVVKFRALRAATRR